MPKTQTLEIAPIFHKRLSDPLPVQIVLIGLTLLFFVGFIFLPLALVFAQAFSKGWEYYLESIREPYALEAVKLTLTTVAIVVPLNAFFGVTAAWAITMVRKPLLISIPCRAECQRQGINHFGSYGNLNLFNLTEH